VASNRAATFVMGDCVCFRAVTFVSVPASILARKLLAAFQLLYSYANHLVVILVTSC